MVAAFLNDASDLRNTLVSLSRSTVCLEFAAAEEIQPESVLGFLPSGSTVSPSGF